MTTVYSFHRAEDHAILAIADPGNLQSVAASVARSICTTPRARRVYIHNGKAIIGGAVCRNGLWHDDHRPRFTSWDTDARAARDAAGYPNH